MDVCAFPYLKTVVDEENTLVDEILTKRINTKLKNFSHLIFFPSLRSLNSGSRLAIIMPLNLKDIGSMINIFLMVNFCTIFFSFNI